MKNFFSKKKNDDEFFTSMKRYEAFLEGEVADRPPVCFTFHKPDAASKPVIPKAYASDKERWMDVEQRAKELNHYIDNTEFYADAMPTVFPNLGPEVLSAYCGCNYHFSTGTTWTDPIIIDWEKDARRAVFDRNNEYFRASEDFTRELQKYSKDKFAIGFTDCHAGGDHLAALRDPEVLCTDLYDYPDEVLAKIDASYEEYFRIYDYFYSAIRLNDSPCAVWISSLISDKRLNVVQNDFSCMVSPAMFEKFFLGGLIKECDELDISIYHLDGPDALRHLDAILDIRKLNAVQWVCGAGNEGFDRWIHVYKKIQAAKKGIYIDVHISELDSVFKNLKPDGMWFHSVSGINSKSDADAVIQRIRNWR